LKRPYQKEIENFNITVKEDSKKKLDENSIILSEEDQIKDLNIAVPSIKRDNIFLKEILKM